MSFGMAFFSITMLLSIAGFHVADLRRLDLSSKGITKAYYSTQARAVRYYENIRLVYEIESRVRDLRRVATPPAKQEEPRPSRRMRRRAITGKTRIAVTRTTTATRASPCWLRVRR